MKEKPKDEVLSAFRARSSEISGIFTSFYIANVAQQSQAPASPSKIQHALFDPPRPLTLCPSSAPNKAAEEVKVVIQELVLETVAAVSRGRAKDGHGADVIQDENRELRAELEQRKEQLAKLTETYYKELNVLREQLFRQHTTKTTETAVPVRFFAVEDGLPEQMCAILNLRLKEVKDGIEERLAESEKAVRNATEELQRYRSLSRKDYPLAGKPLSQTLSKLKQIFSPNRDAFWEGLASGIGTEYLCDLVEERCGRPPAVPISELKQEINAVRVEARDMVLIQLQEAKMRCLESEKRADELERGLTAEREKIMKIMREFDRGRKMLERDLCRVMVTALRTKE